MVSDSLSCSDYKIMKFEILLSMLKVSTTTKVIDFRRANCSSEHSWAGFHGMFPRMIKELASAGSFSRTLFWKYKNSSSPLKVREAGKARHALGLTASF